MRVHFQRTTFAAAGLVAAAVLLLSGVAAAQQIDLDCTGYLREAERFEKLRDQMYDEELKDFPGVSEARKNAEDIQNANGRRIRNAVQQYDPLVKIGPSTARTDAEKWAEWNASVARAKKQNPRMQQILDQVEAEDRAAWAKYQTLFDATKKARFAKQIAEARGKYNDCLRQQAAAEREAKRQQERERRENMTEEEKLKEWDMARALQRMVMILEGVRVDEEPTIDIGALSEGADKVLERQPTLTKTQKETVRRINKRVLERQQQQPGHDPNASAIAAEFIGAAVGVAVERLQRQRSHPAPAPASSGGGSGPSTYKPPPPCNDASCIDPRKVPQADIFRRR